MAPPRKHDTDLILDAARALVLTAGPRAAGVAAIAKASGAPVGTLYHRFGSRDGVLVAVWLRALERFQIGWLAAAAVPDPLDRGAAMAAATVAFARRTPEDAQLLIAVRRQDLLDKAPDAALRERLDAMNAPLIAEVRRLARDLGGGRPDARQVDAVARAVVDLPYATARRHAAAGRFPRWLEEDVAAQARTLLRAG